jgi:4-carboxymuconolactone decarboxylase
MARIPYADPWDLPSEKRDLLDSLSDADTGDERAHSLRAERLNVYRLLGRNPAVLDSVRSNLGTAWSESGLTPHERETVILSTARHADSRYEWHQHVRVALDEGMDPEQILAIARREYDRLPDEQAAIAAYVEQFVAQSVDDEIHDRLATHYDDATVVGIGALAGSYLGLAHVLDALDVDFETEFVGWDLEGL